MYHIQIGINISSEAKTDFIVNELIPFLEEHVKDNYYFRQSEEYKQSKRLFSMYSN